MAALTNAEHAEKFGKKLTDMMYDKRITQSQMAKALHVPKGTVYNWMHGLRYPRAAAMDDICRVLMCTRAELMDDEPAPAPVPEPIPDADPMVDAALEAAGYDYLRALFAVAKDCDKKDIDFVTEILRNIQAKKGK